MAIIALDTETYKWEKGRLVPTLDSREFKIGCVKTETGKTSYFYNPEWMYAYLTSLIRHEAEKGRRTFIYGHNIEYDFYGFCGLNALKDPDMKIISLNPFIAIYANKGFFLDSFSFFKMPLWKGNAIRKHKPMPNRLLRKA